MVGGGTGTGGAFGGAKGTDAGSPAVGGAAAASKVVHNKRRIGCKRVWFREEGVGVKLGQGMVEGIEGLGKCPESDLSIYCHETILFLLTLDRLRVWISIPDVLPKGGSRW